MVLIDDPRCDPRLAAALVSGGMGGSPIPLPVNGDSPTSEIYDFFALAESMFGDVFSAFAAAMPAVEGVTSSVEVIKGIDGNDITLFVHRPSTVDGLTGDDPTRPGILHIHGGGMTFLEAAGGVYPRWRDQLAAMGAVVIGVEFRNAAGKHGNHPFPAGLNDCTSALQWISDNKAGLGISTVVVSGESGGGNLSLATALAAKRDGRLAQIDGVYAQCPYISNAYGVTTPELTSLYENEGYFLTPDFMSACAKAYDPTGENATNPLAWPYHATKADLEGLPPHVISVNQLDPLRDEGLAYFAKLLGAGVSAVSRTVNGTAHGADCLFGAAIPDVYMATIRDILSFAGSL